jgi:hypothetical protein
MTVRVAGMSEQVGDHAAVISDGRCCRLRVDCVWIGSATMWPARPEDGLREDELASIDPDRSAALHRAGAV